LIRNRSFTILFLVQYSIQSIELLSNKIDEDKKINKFNKKRNIREYEIIEKYKKIIYIIVNYQEKINKKITLIISNKIMKKISPIIH
jgi:hypothetical protein